MLRTLFVSAEDLAAYAREEAASLGHRRVGTEHLLIAMMRREAGLCSELLRREGIELEAVLTLAEERDAEVAADEVEGEGEPQPTGRVWEVLRFSHEHAVLLESEEIGADHLLLAIAVSGEGTAAAALEEKGYEARERIQEALVDSLAQGELPSPAPLSITAREAAAIAWSHTLAVGRDEIEIDDLLRGICAPGWTIGARAVAALGEVPDWAPLLWVNEPPEEPYRRIPFGEAAREALRMASEEAARLGRDHIGTEHLLLGICQAAIDRLQLLVGRELSLEEVREAVATAVSGGEEARDAEARRRGWRPEQEAASSLAAKAVARAREIAEETGEEDPDGGRAPGCWHGLLAAILLNEDENLAELLADMELEPAQIHGLGKGEDDLPLADAIALAEGRQWGTELEPVDLILATVAVGSPRLLTALDKLGLTGNEVQAQLAEWRLRQEEDAPGAPSVQAVTALNLLLGAITSMVLLQAVISQGSWWKLIFLPLVWSGYPGYGPLGSTVAAGVLALAVSPLVGILHLLGVPADVAQAKAERQAIWARTGIRLSLRELRCVTRRNLGQMGQLNQSLRQIARTMMPALLRRRKWLG